MIEGITSVAQINRLVKEGDKKKRQKTTKYGGKNTSSTDEDLDE